jgi:hypothetical protein
MLENKTALILPGVTSQESWHEKLKNFLQCILKGATRIHFDLVNYLLYNEQKNPDSHQRQIN